ncbi:hypothetical protein ATCCBAA256_03240 [Mycobacterium montefiorense]|nr:hypothetical protein ATCCBAA256_03240 [Mycobacterium montefiorense]
MGHHHGCGPVARRKGRVACQQSIQRAAQRVNVDPAVDASVGKHLGRGVADGGQYRPGGGQPHVVKCASNPEVAEQDSLIWADRAGEHEVARFDVAVDDVVGVGEIERPGHVRDDVDSTVRGHGSVAERVLGVGAVDKLHRDPQLAVVGLSARVHRHDLGVIQGGRGVGFADKTRPKIPIA